MALSLLANLFLIGATFGHMGRNMMACGSRHIDLQELVTVLSPEKRNKLENEVAKSEHETQILRDQLLEGRRKAVAIVKATPFDNNTYMAQIKIIQDMRAHITQNIGDTIAKIAAQATEEERAGIAAILSDNIH